MPKLKLFALGMGNESLKFKRERHQLVNEMSKVGGFAKTVFFLLGVCYIYFG